MKLIILKNNLEFKKIDPNNYKLNQSISKYYVWVLNVGI